MHWRFWGPRHEEVPLANNNPEWIDGLTADGASWAEDDPVNEANIRSDQPGEAPS